MSLSFVQNIFCTAALYNHFPKYFCDRKNLDRGLNVCRLGEFMFGPAAAAPQAGEMSVSVQCPPESLYQSQWEERLSRGEDEEEKHFCMLMENLGASNVFEE